MKKFKVVSLLCIVSPSPVMAVDPGEYRIVPSLSFSFKPEDTVTDQRVPDSDDEQLSTTEEYCSESEDEDASYSVVFDNVCSIVERNREHLADFLYQAFSIVDFLTPHRMTQLIGILCLHDDNRALLSAIDALSHAPVSSLPDEQKSALYQIGTMMSLLQQAESQR